MRRTSCKLSFPDWGCVCEKSFFQLIEFLKLGVCLCEKDFLKDQFPRLKGA